MARPAALFADRREVKQLDGPRIHGLFVLQRGGFVLLIFEPLCQRGLQIFRQRATRLGALNDTLEELHLLGGGHPGKLACAARSGSPLGLHAVAVPAASAAVGR